MTKSALLMIFSNLGLSTRVSLRMILFIVLSSNLFLPVFINADGSQALFFVNLTTEDGLSSNVASAIVQDKYGFIWIGTLDGLSRFDGYNMQHFQSGKSAHSLSFSNITALLEDGEKMWVGTWDGLNVIDVKSFLTHKINTGNARVIRALYKDKAGRIWIGTSEGVLIFEEGMDTLQHINTSNSKLSHNMIRAFYQSPDGDMWIGTYDGLNRYKDGEITVYNLKGDYKPLLENNLIVSIAPPYDNADSILWVGTETGLAVLDTNTGESKLYNNENSAFSNEVIKTIFALNDSILLLGTDFGLNTFNPSTGSNKVFYHDPLIDNTIVSNVVWDIFEDNSKRLWLATSNGISIIDNSEPLFRLHEEYYSYDNPRIGNQVRDILVARNGDIWLATIHGVVHHNRATGKSRSFSSSSEPRYRILLDNVYSLQQDSLGRIWMGTAGGLNVWDESKQQMHSITANRQNGLLSNYINNFIVDKSGNIWLTAWEGGLFKGSSKSGDLGDLGFVMVDEDGDGRILIAGDSLYYASRNSLWCINPVTLQKNEIVKVGKELNDNYISGITTDNKGELWIGSENRLLHYMPANDSLSVTAFDTGRSRKLNNLEVDSHGNVWATIQRSIIRFDRQRNSYFTIPISRISPIKSFGTYSSAISESGKILVGGDNGYLELDTEDLHIPDTKPEVFITGLRVNNQIVLPVDSVGIISEDMAFVEKIKLKYKQNSLTFEFSTLDYLFPDVSQYSYRLLPVQEKWQKSSGDRNFAIYSNLKPGNYQLEVRGANHLGAWSDIKRVEFRVTPSLWLSKGFIILYISVIVLLTYLIFRIFTYRQRLRNELQLVKVEKEHSEAMYQAKMDFFTNISHEFRTPLTLIIPPIKELLGKIDDSNGQTRMLHIALRNAQRLYKLVNQLLDFRRIESSKLTLKLIKTDVTKLLREVYHSFDDMASRHEIEYEFFEPLEPLIADLDDEKLEIIAFNLLSNAFKFTPFAGVITLRLELINEDIIISVEDSGPGIDEAEQEQIFDRFYQSSHSSTKVGTGIGLTLAREYARLHNGSLKVESGKYGGSRFQLTVPHLNLPNTAWKDSYSLNSSIAPLRMPVEADSSYEDTKGLKRIVLVDDNQDILYFMEMNLRGSYQLLCATNGEEGLQLVRTNHPHLVISDVMMPVMDGLQLCSAIKGEKSTAHIPVILLTAKSLTMDKIEGVDRGADMYITKPFDIDYLKSCIASLFRRDAQLEEFFTKTLLMRPKGDDSELSDEDEVFLKKVMAVIESNISNPDLSVEMIAMDVGFSATHLYRKLKQYTGYSTKEILVNYRMQKAADMILNRNGNITEIMYAVGFSSLASFSRSFKARYGIAPSAYADNGALDNTIPSPQNP